MVEASVASVEGRSLRPADTGADGALDAALDAAPCPVLVVDPSGAVVRSNAAATGLFPGASGGTRVGAVAPDWLAAAHARLADGSGTGADEAGCAAGVVRGEAGGRSIEARPARCDNGDVVWWLVDDTDRRRAEEALRQERERTAFLADTSNLMLASLNLDRCMDVTAQLAALHLADAAVVVAPAAGRRLPVVRCGPDGAVVRDKVAADPTAVPGLAEALRGFPPVPSRWIDPSVLPEWVVPSGFHGPVGAVGVTPLPGHGVPAGALILLRGSGHAAFTEDEDVFARLFAARAGAAMWAARLYAEQASITRTLMRDLLPPQLRQVHGVEFAGGYRASQDSERVGGDFYDVHPAPDAGQESLVVLGDVCGKGLEAAVLTGKIRNTLHALLPMADDHERMLDLLNGALLTAQHTRFATLLLASVLRRDASVRLRLTSAGHPAPLIVRTGGQVEEADTRGTLVGALPQVHAHTTTVELAPGETCLLFTDGITEARGGPLGDDMFGDDRLQEAFAECAGMPADAVVERILMLGTEWVGDGRHDDMAVIAITAPRSAHLSAVDGRTRGRYTA